MRYHCALCCDVTGLVIPVSLALGPSQHFMVEAQWLQTGLQGQD